MTSHAIADVSRLVFCDFVLLLFYFLRRSIWPFSGCNGCRVLKNQQNAKIKSSASTEKNGFSSTSFRLCESCVSRKSIFTRRIMQFGGTGGTDAVMRCGWRGSGRSTMKMNIQRISLSNSLSDYPRRRGQCTPTGSNSG